MALDTAQKELNTVVTVQYSTNKFHFIKHPQILYTATFIVDK